MTPPAATGPAFQGSAPVIWITCASDGCEHAISEDGLVAAGRGSVYSAICGHAVIPEALITPPGRRCTHCDLRQLH